MQTPKEIEASIEPEGVRLVPEDRLSHALMHSHAGVSEQRVTRLGTARSRLERDALDRLATQ